MHLRPQNSKSFSFPDTRMDSRDLTTAGAWHKDDPGRRPAAKCVYKIRIQRAHAAILEMTREQLEYHHETSELTTGRNGGEENQNSKPPPEISDIILRGALSKLGHIKNITEELWSRAYGYPVSNGIRIVSLGLKQHIAPHLSVAENRVLVSYEAQPSTCYALHRNTTEATRSWKCRQQVPRSVFTPRANTWSPSPGGKPDSSVGLVTHYWLDSPGIESIPLADVEREGLWFVQCLKGTSYFPSWWKWEVK